MTIKTSGTLSLNEISSEYSGTPPHSLAEYYGAPSLPSSGPISFSDFYNKSDLYSTVSTTSLQTFVETSSGWNTSWSTSYLTYWTTYWSTYNPSYEMNQTTRRSTSRATSRTTGVYEYLTYFNTSVVTSWSAGNPT
jgi:hypothetical protein